MTLPLWKFIGMIFALAEIWLNGGPSSAASRDSRPAVTPPACRIICTVSPSDNNLRRYGRGIIFYADDAGRVIIPRERTGSIIAGKDLVIGTVDPRRVRELAKWVIAAGQAGHLWDRSSAAVDASHMTIQIVTEDGNHEVIFMHTTPEHWNEFTRRYPMDQARSSAVFGVLAAFNALQPEATEPCPHASDVNSKHFEAIWTTPVPARQHGVILPD